MLQLPQQKRQETELPSRNAPSFFPRQLESQLGSPWTVARTRYQQHWPRSEKNWLPEPAGQQLPQRISLVNQSSQQLVMGECDRRHLDANLFQEFLQYREVFADFLQQQRCADHGQSFSCSNVQQRQHPTQGHYETLESIRRQAKARAETTAQSPTIPVQTTKEEFRPLPDPLKNTAMSNMFVGLKEELYEVQIVGNREIGVYFSAEGVAKAFQLKPKFYKWKRYRKGVHLETFKVGAGKEVYLNPLSVTTAACDERCARAMLPGMIYLIFLGITANGKERCKYGMTGNREKRTLTLSQSLVRIPLLSLSIGFEWTVIKCAFRELISLPSDAPGLSSHE